MKPSPIHTGVALDTCVNLNSFAFILADPEFLKS